MPQRILDVRAYSIATMCRVPSPSFLGRWIQLICLLKRTKQKTKTQICNCSSASCLIDSTTHMTKDFSRSKFINGVGRTKELDAMFIYKSWEASRENRQIGKTLFHLNWNAQIQIGFWSYKYNPGEQMMQFFDTSLNFSLK